MKAFFIIPTCQRSSICSSGNIIIGQSDGIIGVTDEITTFWAKRLFYRKIPRTTIPNGFNVHSVEVRTLPPLTRILFISFLSEISVAGMVWTG